MIVIYKSSNSVPAFIRKNHALPSQLSDGPNLLICTILNPYKTRIIYCKTLSWIYGIMEFHNLQTEVRKIKLENLRYATRILDSQLDDLDTEKKVIVGRGVNAHLNQ